MTALRLLIMTLLAGSGAAAIACENPPLVQIPAGGLDERARQRVADDFGEYIEAMKVYTACIQAELAAAGGDNAPPLMKAALVMRNNGAVAEVNAMIKVFNDRLGAAAEGPPVPGAAPAPEQAPRGRDRD